MNNPNSLTFWAVDYSLFIIHYSFFSLIIPLLHTWATDRIC